MTDVTAGVAIAGEVLDEEVLDDKEVLDGEEVLDEDVGKNEKVFIFVYLHSKAVEEIGIINERTQALDRQRSQNFPLAQRILRVYVVYYPTPWSSRRYQIPQSLRLSLRPADLYQRGRRTGWVRNPMKLRRSLCVAIVARENRWLYLFFEVDEDML
jgi:hypothetical protein